MLVKVLFIFLISITLSAQSADVIVKKIQTKFSAVEDLKANFTQKIISELNESPITLSGKFYFKKVEKIRIEVSGRNIISDGITIWNHDQKNNKVIISTYDSDYTSFSLNEIINSYPKLCDNEIVEEQSGISVIRLTPNEDQLNFKSALISINKSNMITKVEITDFNNMKFIFTLDSIEINNNLSNQFFSYESSEGAEIIDLR